MNHDKTLSLLDTQLRRTLGNLLAVLALFFSCNVGAVFAAAGALDSSFDGDGIRIVTQPKDNRGQAVAIQPTDGKIVIAGYTNTFGSNDVMVLRLNDNGSLDGTFNGGQARIVSRFGDDRGLAVALQSDGKIVVAGYTNLFGTNDILVMRFNADGSLDTTFNFSNLGGRPSGGVKIVDRGGDDRAKAITIQSDGKIVVAGTSTVFGSNNVLVLRFNANGSLDTTFNNGGSQIIKRTSDDRACAVALQRDGKIVVAGYTNALGSNDIQVLRFNTNGGLDTTFNTSNVGGRVTGGIQVVSQFGDDRGQAIALQSDGKVVVAGWTDRFGDKDIQVVRLNSNGSLDLTFNPSNTQAGLVGGSVVVRQSRSNDQGQAVALQTDGKVVVGGYTDRFGLNDFLVMRFNSNGVLDTTFDGDGIRIVDSFGNNQANALALQADKKIVVVGHTDTSDVNDIEVMRFLGQ